MNDPQPIHSSGVASAITYARDVLAGGIDACRLVRLACARFLDDFGTAEAGNGPWALPRFGRASDAVRRAHAEHQRPGGRAATAAHALAAAGLRQPVRL